MSQLERRLASGMADAIEKYTKLKAELTYLRLEVRDHFKRHSDMDESEWDEILEEAKAKEGEG